MILKRRVITQKTGTVWVQATIQNNTTNTSGTLDKFFQIDNYVVKCSQNGYSFYSSPTNLIDIGKVWRRLSVYPRKLARLGNGKILFIDQQNCLCVANNTTALLNGQITYMDSITVEVSTITTGYLGQTQMTTSNTTINNLRVLDFAVDTTNGYIALICANNNGVIYSTDNMTSWKKADNNIKNISLSKIYFAGGRFYAFDSEHTYYGSGSSLNANLSLVPDFTKNWAQFNYAWGTTYDMCVINSTLYTCTASGLLATTDFTLLSLPNGAACYSIKSISSRLIACTSQGLYYSEDGGSTWTAGTDNTVYYDIMLLNYANRTCAHASTGMYYSEPVYGQQPYYKYKYLDQNGAQEIVTQFKAYCDAKVGA